MTIARTSASSLNRTGPYFPAPVSAEAALLTILVVDDDRSVAYALDRALTEKGHAVHLAFSAEEGLNTLRDSPADIVLLDLYMPGMDGTEMLRQIKKSHPATDVVTMSGAGSMRAVLGTLQLDAFDFLPKPIQMRALMELIDKVREKRATPRHESTTRPLSTLFTVPDLIGKSPSIQKVADFLNRIAPTLCNVLIRGETGTGKEVVAHTLHGRSARREGPFIPLNCSALPETMLESELFGHEKGAFTDATGLKKGLLEMANGGTLLLDEIGDMPLPLQAKLLRVVETKRFRRLGSNTEQSVDVRFVGATHRDLETLVKKNQFREDLYYRLSVFSLHLPPLRDRKEDIPLLANFFIQSVARGKGPHELSPEALSRLESYPWPGNVRELHNIIEHAVVFAEGDVVKVGDLPLSLQRIGSPRLDDASETLSAVERRHILAVFELSGESIEQTAQRLGISETLTRNRLKRYGRIPVS
ncbi:MAG: sigma-54-dependent Fis family transcriptional regulator [Elusimicrobia bacterium]|nr:sigma-54-dependent Fis family transcriptional regulator [Elusimicrobiota bacterium]